MAISGLTGLGVLGAWLTCMVVLYLTPELLSILADAPTSLGYWNLAGFVIVPFAFPLGIGFPHALQLRSAEKYGGWLWFAATLCVYSELLLAILATGIGAIIMYFLSGLKVQSTDKMSLLMGTAFWLTVLTLMIFRPLVLAMVRPLLPLVSRFTRRSFETAHQFLLLLHKSLSPR